jgi:hypothetical protein
MKSLPPLLSLVLAFLAVVGSFISPIPADGPPARRRRTNVHRRLQCRREDRSEAHGRPNPGHGQGDVHRDVLIQFDDIVINTDGIIPATIVPADSSQPTILSEGARRVVIDGRVTNGLTVNGGLAGIFATRGSALDVKNCRVMNTSANAVIATYSSSLVVDNTFVV